MFNFKLVVSRKKVFFIEFINRNKNAKTWQPIGLNPKTWKVYYPDTPAKYVLELSQGTVKQTGTELGDILDFRQFVFPYDC